MNEKKFPYKFSTAYGQMFDLINAGQTLIAIILSDGYERVCEVRRLAYDDAIDFNTLGIGYLTIRESENFRADFVARCTAKKILFLPISG